MAPTQEAGVLNGKRIVLIISGGIAAYKSLDLIRRLRERGARVIPIMTRGAQQFITPLAVGALSAEKVFTELFDREAEQDVGHIRLARDNDLILIAPATADLMAKMAHGIADDLATAVLLATDKPVLIAPAMNPKMWANPATTRNVETLRQDGKVFIGPERGEMAESGEAGLGRMSEPLEIVAAAEALFSRETVSAPAASRSGLMSAITPSRIRISCPANSRRWSSIVRIVSADLIRISGMCPPPTPSEDAGGPPEGARTRGRPKVLANPAPCNQVKARRRIKRPATAPVLGRGLPGSPPR